MKPINIILNALMLALLATLAPLATPLAADTPSLVAADYYVAAEAIAMKQMATTSKLTPKW
jgi:hypothetical protein